VSLSSTLQFKVRSGLFLYVYTGINVCLNSSLHARKSKKIAYLIEIRVSNEKKKKEPEWEKEYTLFSKWNLYPM
jgi:hypothetical protein